MYTVTHIIILLVLLLLDLIKLSAYFFTLVVSGTVRFLTPVTTVSVIFNSFLLSNEDFTGIEHPQFTSPSSVWFSFWKNNTFLAVFSVKVINVNKN